MLSTAALALLGLAATPALAQLPRLDSTTLSATASSSKASSPPDLAIDGNTGTPWKSQAGFPVELVLDLGESMAIDGLDYLSVPWLTSRGLNANAYEVAVADGDAPPTDDGGWSTVADGALAANPAKNTFEKVSFAEATGRFVRLLITSSHGGAFTNAGEVGVFAGPAGSTPPPTVPPPTPPPMTNCGDAQQAACVDGDGNAFCNEQPAGDEPLAPRPGSNKCVPCGRSGRLPCLAPNPPCQDLFELRTRVSGSGDSADLYCGRCGNNCDSFGSVPEVFETTYDGGNCPAPPVRLGTGRAVNQLNLNDFRRDYAESQGQPYPATGGLPLTYGDTPNGGSFCITPTSAPIVIGGTVAFSDNCDVPPAAPDGSPCCEIRFWQPNQNDLYFDYCSATVPVGPGGVYWAFTEMPGNEENSGWGPDFEPHVHWEVNCSGCVATAAMPQGTYVGRDTTAAATGFNKFYPLDVFDPAAGPEHAAEQFGDSVFKYDIIL